MRNKKILVKEIRELFESKAFVFASSLVFICYSLFRAVRAPNLWSATQMQWNYDFGFIRRGFIGELLSKTNLLNIASYDTFFIFSYVILILEILLILRLFLKISGNIDGGRILALSWFVSLAFVFHIHTVGYADHILVLITLLLAVIPLNKIIYGFIAIILCISGILTHEIFLVIGIPVLLVRILLTYKHTISRQALPLCAVFLSVLLAFIFTFWPFATLDTEHSIRLEKSISERVDFPLREDNFKILNNNTAAASAYVIGELLSEKAGVERLCAAAIKILPTTLLYIVLSLAAIFQFMPKRNNFIYFVIISFLSCSPLILIFVGWDFERWFSLSATVSFIIFLTIMSEMKQGLLIKLDYRVVLALFIMFVSLSSYQSIRLMDFYVLKSFPISERMKQISDYISGGEKFPFMPPR